MLQMYIYYAVMLRIPYLLDTRTNCDVSQLFALQYAKCLAKMLRMVCLRNKKMFWDQTEATSFQPGIVPVPVPVPPIAAKPCQVDVVRFQDDVWEMFSVVLHLWSTYCWRTTTFCNTCVNWNVIRGVQLNRKIDCCNYSTGNMFTSADRCIAANQSNIAARLCSENLQRWVNLTRPWISFCFNWLLSFINIVMPSRSVFVVGWALN